MKKASEKIIMGIDPGTNLMGYALIRTQGAGFSLLGLGVLNFTKLDDPYLKLKGIFKEVSSLIDRFHPDELAVEAPFFGKNVQSMLKLGRAQGVAIAAAVSREIPVTEYSPRKVKQAVTGNGNAAKEKVAEMLVRLLGTQGGLLDGEKLDATDALAVAVCHHYQASNPVSKGGKKGWDSFIRNNPDRVK
jgi:crossover junction endodeoxyribonuclease RuvC